MLDQRESIKQLTKKCHHRRQINDGQHYIAFHLAVSHGLDHLLTVEGHHYIIPVQKSNSALASDKHVRICCSHRNRG